MSHYNAAVGLWSQGASNREIADRLHLSMNTVAAYLSRARRDGALPPLGATGDVRFCDSCGAPRGRWKRDPRGHT